MMPDVLTVVVDYEIGDGEGGGAYEVGTAPRGSAEFRELIAQAVADAEGLTHDSGYEWAAVRFGAGDVEAVGCEAGDTVHVVEG